MLLAAVFGLFMAWGIGANDVANAMGTSVGAGALTLKQAVMVAAVFEFLGAFLAGGEVTSTIRSGIISAESIATQPHTLVLGMLSALLAAAIWLLVASSRGWPVSTTHSIVGAIVGFAVVAIGIDSVNWGKIWIIISSWVVSPLVAGVLSFLIFKSVRLLVLDRDDQFEYARRYVPVYIFLAGFVIALVTLLRGFRHVGLGISTQQSYLLAAIFGIAVALAGAFHIRRIKPTSADTPANVEKIFAVLMIVTACGMAFAHGSNDVANAIGPVAAVISTVQAGAITNESTLSTWILLLGGVGIVLGLLMYGKNVMATIGRSITELTPSRGFAAELAAASTVVIASGTGIPVSTTHTLVGAVVGIGLAHGIESTNFHIVRKIFISWIITLPVGAILAIIFYYILRMFFG
jgi:PiT family inorganic phosphate transporter